MKSHCPDGFSFGGNLEFISCSYVGLASDLHFFSAFQSTDRHIHTLIEGAICSSGAIWFSILLKHTRGIQPATFRYLDTLLYLLSYSRPAAVHKQADRCDQWVFSVVYFCLIKHAFPLCLTGHAIFKLTYLSNHDYKPLYFESDAATVNEIVLKVSYGWCLWVATFSFLRIYRISNNLDLVWTWKTCLAHKYAWAEFVHPKVLRDFNVADNQEKFLLHYFMYLFPPFVC